ncbi:hypothetical protein PR048_019300 [Dryococelus australis]|uniref:Uncharacterized protein n=1 Tax=Dryococelus australis TaxID=614101 RepID=A0ABQ9H343_9NEOP|nr:hypothetical protein PR048_019300 [Dryococelus australis]
MFNASQYQHMRPQSHSKQMYISIRYVDLESRTVRGVLISFVKVITEKTTNFARDSPKRLDWLKKKIQENCPDITGYTLLLFCESRRELIPAVVSFLEETIMYITGEALVKANGL